MMMNWWSSLKYYYSFGFPIDLSWYLYPYHFDEKVKKKQHIKVKKLKEKGALILQKAKIT
jgi:hypothetical protein